MGQPQSAPAVGRAAAVLGFVAESPGPQRLSDIAAALDLAVSSTSAICNALEDSRLLSRDRRGYLLGPRILELSRAYLGASDPVANFSSIVANDPALQSETVQLGLLDGPDVLYLVRRDAPRPFAIASNVGTRLPASCTAIGKAVLARIPEDQRNLPTTLPQLTDKSIGDHGLLTAELEVTARRGYGIDDEETSVGVMCLAVAIPSVAGPRYGMGVTILKARHTAGLEAELAAALQSAASTIGSAAATGHPI